LHIEKKEIGWPELAQNIATSFFQSFFEALHKRVLAFAKGLMFMLSHKPKLRTWEKLLLRLSLSALPFN
jgi:hypothetical protein